MPNLYRSLARLAGVILLASPWPLAGYPATASTGEKSPAPPNVAFALLTPTTYIYGYNNRLPIAVVSNARADQVAYTSFESADQGYWTYSGAPTGSATTPGRTGIRYYPLSAGNIRRTGLPPGKYLLSYWSSARATVSGTNYALVGQSAGTAINGWTYYETVFTLSANNSSITLSGSVNLDELRLHPFEAQMVTTTFDPLVGKTSETDANNVTLYYEYDAFNRLQNVRDQRGYIRKTYQYTYKP